MLSQNDKKAVEALCFKHGLGNVEFQDSGIIHFKHTDPIEKEVMKIFGPLGCRLIDSGMKTWDQRPDDMRITYWVSIIPESSEN